MNEYEAVVEGYQQGITEELRENPVLMTVHPQTIPYTQAWQ